MLHVGCRMQMRYEKHDEATRGKIEQKMDTE